MASSASSSSSIRRLLAAAVLLSVLAAASGSVGTSCVPGWGIPHNPLPSCRRYVQNRLCGPYGPRLPLPELKRRCCGELADIAEYCRCTALSYLIDGVIPPGPDARMEGRLEDLPGCPREVQRRFAAALVSEAECNLGTISGMSGCSWILGYDQQQQAMPSK